MTQELIQQELGFMLTHLHQIDAWSKRLEEMGPETDGKPSAEFLLDQIRNPSEQFPDTLKGLPLSWIAFACYGLKLESVTVDEGEYRTVFRIEVGHTKASGPLWDGSFTADPPLTVEWLEAQQNPLAKA